MIQEGWRCPGCHVFNGGEKEVRTTCRSCSANVPPHFKTVRQAIALATSIAQGRPTNDCPIAFSYVQATRWLADFILQHEADRDSGLGVKGQ
jgi:hypothetical protein